MEPTQKRNGLDTFFATLTGRDRRVSIKSNICNWCGQPALAFKDELSIKEYTISGLCQVCQDKVENNSGTHLA